MCRIQLKLPAGNATVLEMSRTDTLAVLRERVAKVCYITSVASIYVHSSIIEKRKCCA